MNSTISKLLLISTLASSPAMALGGFIGDYTPANWTIQLSSGSTGFIQSHSATNLVFVGSNGDSGISKLTTVQTTATTSGTVSFSWSYSNVDVDGANFDRFSFLQNLSLLQLSNNAGAANQSGSESFPIGLGEFFGFRINATDDTLGAATVTITNFSFTPSETEIPFGVDSTAGLALLGAASAWKFRRRRKA